MYPSKAIPTKHAVDKQLRTVSFVEKLAVFLSLYKHSTTLSYTCSMAFVLEIPMSWLDMPHKHALKF